MAGGGAPGQGAAPPQIPHAQRVQTNAHHTGRAHCDGAPVHYARHRPEQTTLYRLVQQHAATFIAQAEDAAGADLPQFVKDEFDAFLECGILAHGFLRLRCGDCGHDKLLAFSPMLQFELLQDIEESLRIDDMAGIRARIDDISELQEWLDLDKFDRLAVNHQLKQFSANDPAWQLG